MATLEVVPPRDSKSLQWTCGGDPNLVCDRHISGGGYGFVFEVQAGQLFY
jgi:hypothetical protein